MVTGAALASGPGGWRESRHETSSAKTDLGWVRPRRCGQGVAASIAAPRGKRHRPHLRGLCEVVIHDFSDPEHSIVWIEGDVTKRKIGGSVTEIGLALIRGGDSQEDLIGYTQNTKDGKVLRSSTILLRDTQGHVFGCLCINLDITEVLGFRKAITQLVPEIGGQPVSVQFTDQIEEVLGRIVEEALAENPKPPGMMGREERLALIAALDRRGAFQIQRAVPTMPRFLRVSRTSVYTYLNGVRNQASAASD